MPLYPNIITIMEGTHLLVRWLLLEYTLVGRFVASFQKSPEDIGQACRGHYR